MHHQAGYPSGEVDSLNGLAEVLLAEGRTGEAGREYTAALGLATEIGLKFDQARAHDGLGRVHQLTDDLSQAREHWQQALALYIELGVPEAEDLRALLAELRSGPPARFDLNLLLSPDHGPARRSDQRRSRRALPMATAVTS